MKSGAAIKRDAVDEGAPENANEPAQLVPDEMIEYETQIAATQSKHDGVLLRCPLSYGLVDRVIQSYNDLVTAVAARTILPGLAERSDANTPRVRIR